MQNHFYIMQTNNLLFKTIIQMKIIYNIHKFLYKYVVPVDYNFAQHKIQFEPFTMIF